MHPARFCLADVARHVIAEYQATQETRGHSALDDVANSVHPALMCGVSPANSERVMVRRCRLTVSIPML
jgi:hypothetical protein